MKILQSIAPFLYLTMVLFVVFHNTGYQLSRMLDTPYILYVLLTLVSTFVIRSVIKQSSLSNEKFSN
jgi:lipoprotein signal peptidase